MINNAILNIMLILFYNVLKTLKWKHMLRLTSSDSLCICWHTSRIVWLFLSRYDQWINNEGS